MQGPNKPWTAEDEANVKELQAMIEQHLAEHGGTIVNVAEVKMEVLDRVAATTREAGWLVDVRPARGGFQITVSRP